MFRYVTINSNLHAFYIVCPLLIINILSQSHGRIVTLICSEKICFFCCKLLSRHSEVSTVLDEVIKLVLINTHQGRMDVTHSLTKSSLLPIFKGGFLSLVSTLLSYMWNSQRLNGDSFTGSESVVVIG